MTPNTIILVSGALCIFAIVSSIAWSQRRNPEAWGIK